MYVPVNKTKFRENTKPHSHNLKGVEFLTQLTQMELQNLRHMIGAHETVANKLDAYAQNCNDAQLKQLLQQDALAARHSKQKLLTFLQ
jgi:hypothetical protein